MLQEAPSPLPSKAVDAYVPTRFASSRQIPIRTLSYHVLSWGQPGPAVPLVLLHGWMDIGASYQFVVDALSAGFADSRLIIAPDWRGFGRSRMPGPCDRHDFADYLADLDQLLDVVAGEQPVDLVGHSMGGNVAMMYAGARPGRIRTLVNLEGFGLPATRPEQAPARYAQWMDEIRKLGSGEITLKSYDSLHAVAQRLMKTNRRLPQDKALWLAERWAAPNAQGRWEIQGDAAHKVSSAQLYRLDETLALYRAITAPVLAVEASDDSMGQWWKGRYGLEQYHERLKQVHRCQVAVVQDAAHMLHHDQPAAVAALIEKFATST